MARLQNPVDRYRAKAIRLLKELRGSGRAATLPDAFQSIATSAGYSSWDHLVAEVGTADGLDTTLLFPRDADQFLNLWFNNYEEARSAHAEYPHRFLFPYRDQFFICEDGLLKFLGIDPGDPDWESIGRDWMQPQDSEAKERLESRLIGILRQRYA